MPAQGHNFPVWGNRFSIKELIARAEEECKLNENILLDKWSAMLNMTKGLRPLKPESYLGNDHSVKCLETFILGTFMYLCTSRLMRAKLYYIHVNIIGLHLSGSAKEWFCLYVAMSPMAL